MSKRAQPKAGSDQPIEPEILQEGEYIPSAKQAKRYYKAASEYREANSFSHLFGGLMELLTEEDLADIETKVGERRANRRHRLKETILDHEQQAGDIQQAEAELTALKAHLVSLDPEYEPMLAAYDRQAEAAYKRGKQTVRNGFKLEELSHLSKGAGHDFDASDPDLEADYWEENSSGEGANVFGIQF